MSDLHAEGAEFLQAPDDLVGNLRVALDHSGIDLRLAEIAQPGQERLATIHRLRRAAGVRMDQVQPQSAEEQFLAEAGLAPLRLPRLFGDLPGLLLADLFGNGHDDLPMWAELLLDSNPICGHRGAFGDSALLLPERRTH